MNNYPLKTYFLILIIVLIGIIYGLPNLFSADPAIQISGQSGEMEIDQSVMNNITDSLKAANIDYFGEQVDGETGILRLKDADKQLYAKQIIQDKLGLEYVVALNLAPTTPEWLEKFGASPMKLGLDLRGGVHFLLEVNTDEAIGKQMDTIVRQVRTAMREEKLRYESIKLIKRKTIIAVFKTKIDAEKANNIMRKKFTGITRETFGENDSFVIRSEMLESEVKKIQDYAINQNLTTLRNRVNELGVSEPVVQRQGKNRIVVELPGVQDTAAAKRIIGKTANLEFRLEAKPGSSNREKFSFSDSYVRDRGIKNAYLKRTVVITGDHVSKATAGYDEKGTPNVNISLNSQGGARMHRMTRNNIGQRLGVLFIEYKVRTKYEIDSAGEKIAIPERYVDKNIINILLGIGGSGPTKRIPSKTFIKVIDELSKDKKCTFYLATGKNNEEQIILKEILESKFKNDCVPLDDLSIKEILPIIKNCNLSICNDSSFSHLSAALNIKTITLMVDTPIIYGNYNSKMFPIIPDGETTVSHHTSGKDKMNPQKIFDTVIKILN